MTTNSCFRISCHFAAVSLKPGNTGNIVCSQLVSAKWWLGLHILLVCGHPKVAFAFKGKGRWLFCVPQQPTVPQSISQGGWCKPAIVVTVETRFSVSCSRFPWTPVLVHPPWFFYRVGKLFGSATSLVNFWCQFHFFLAIDPWLMLLGLFWKISLTLNFRNKWLKTFLPRRPEIPYSNRPAHPSVIFLIACQNSLKKTVFLSHGSHLFRHSALFVLVILIFKGKSIGIFKLLVFDDIIKFYFLSRFFDAMFMKGRWVI